MKTRLLFLFHFLVAALPGVVQAQDGARTEVVSRGPHHSVHQRTSSRISSAGQPYLVTNSFVELASGLNFWNRDQGRWEPSREVIEIFNDTAVARQGAHKVVWAANLNSPGAVDMEASDGKRFRSHLLGIVFTDARTGKSILIAEPKDSIGEVLGNQIIYRDAFLGPFRTDVRYTYTLAGLSQDILIREAVPSPTEYDATLNPAEVRLEVWTEFIDAPEPVKSVTMLKSRSDPVARQGVVDPDISNETLDWGACASGTAPLSRWRTSPLARFESRVRWERTGCGSLRGTASGRSWLRKPTTSTSRQIWRRYHKQRG